MKVVYSSLSTLTVMEFYRNLSQGLGAQPGYRKTDNFNIIQNEISRYALEKKSHRSSSLMKPTTWDIRYLQI